MLKLLRSARVYDMPDHSVFVGEMALPPAPATTRRPRRSPEPLHVKLYTTRFNLCASACSPGQEKPFLTACDLVAEMKAIDGYNGGHYESEEHILDALYGGYYSGDWFIPTVAMAERLVKNKDTLHLRPVFQETAAIKPFHIWTSTPDGDNVKIIDVNGDDSTAAVKSVEKTYLCYTRPMRMVVL